MKKLLVLTAVLLLSVAPAMAGQFYGKGTVGYDIPNESEADNYFDISVAGGMNLNDMVGAPVSVELGLGYHMPEDIDIFAVTLTGLYELPVEVTDFAFNVGAGIGMYNWSYDVAGYSDDGSDFGWHLQAGADYKLNDQVALVGELRYASVDVDGDDLGATSINLGAKYNF